MLWNRSNTVGLASGACCYCQGAGLRLIYKNHFAPCGCVFRTIFRACLRRFRECAVADSIAGTVTWEFSGGPSSHRTYSRIREEFMADFCLIARRTLSDPEHRLFRYYFLLGADWRLCSRYFHLDRGFFFHALYRIERKLGKALAETEPYALFPLDEYFGGVIRDAIAAMPEQRPNNERKRLRFPLAMIA